MTIPIGILFNDPRPKPLSTTGTIQPGAYYLYYSTGTLTPANVYADGALTTPLSQTPGQPQPSCTADSTGRFNPIYLNPSQVYRVRLYTSAAVLLEDTDPYVVTAISGASAATAAEIATGVAIVNPGYPVGNLLRYGIVPNSNATAVMNSNTSILQALLNPLILNGITGPVWSPNTGGAASASDTYYFNGFIPMRDGVQLDLNNTTWNFTVTSTPATNTGLSYLMAFANVTIQNGTIVANYTATPGNTGSAIGLGFRDSSGGPVAEFYDSVYLAATGHTLGNITLRNLFISMNNAGETGILCLAGLQNVTIDNVWIDGRSTLSTGLYYEFGWGTNQTSRYQRQTSHAHNWRVTNCKFTNMAPGASSSGFSMNGAYNILLDGIYGSNLGSVIGFGLGEAVFLNPWGGQDDIGALSQMPQNGVNLTGTSAAGRNITMLNVTGRLISGTAIVVEGSEGTSGFNTLSGTFQGWRPNTAYRVGAQIYNGAYCYTLASGGGVGSSANTPPYLGPRGTGSGIVDGGLTWNYGVTIGANNYTALYGTGFRGWNYQYSYVAGDIVINGQYAYVCTQANTSTVPPAQGPTGIGTNIADGLGGLWSSMPVSGSTSLYPPTGVPNAWIAETGQLNMTLDGFNFDGNGVGSGVESFCQNSTIRNGRITNCYHAIVTTQDAVTWTVENVTALNCVGGIAFEMGLGNTQWAPPRFASGIIRNCMIAGSNTGGAGIGYAIAMSNAANILIENNRLGYEFIHDGVTESYQQYGVFVGAQVSGQYGNGIVCRNNYITTPTNNSGGAYYLYSGLHCIIDNPLGNDTTYTGPWEGVLQKTVPTLAPATGSFTTITYTSSGGAGTPRLDYIKRGTKVDYTFEIGVTALTVGSASGALKIVGLPYPANNAAVASLPLGAVQIQGFTKTSYTNFSVETSGGANYLTISCTGSGQTLATLSVTDTLTSSLLIFGSGSYFTNS